MLNVLRETKRLSPACELESPALVLMVLRCSLYFSHLVAHSLPFLEASGQASMTERGWKREAAGHGYQGPWSMGWGVVGL